MPAGTIALTNNSTTVTGTGTSFTTELKVNDFVVAIVGGVAYTLGVAAIASNTSLTLIQKYDGPTTSGLTWNPVPFGTMTAITAQLAAQVTYAIRGLNLDKNNWQQIFTGTGNVTVNLPDGSSYTGPAWNSFTTALAGKADLISGAVAVSQGGTGQKTLSGVMTWLGLGDAAFKNTGTSSGTLAAGNDSRLGTVDGKTGGNVSGTLSVSLLLTVPAIGKISGYDQAMNSQGTYINWNRSGVSGGTDIVNNKGGGSGGFRFRIINVDNTSVTADYTLQASGVGLAPGGWQTGSDQRIKEDIKDIDPAFALNAVVNMRHVTFKMRDRPDGEGGWITGERSAGYLAQDLEKYLPETVSTAKSPAVFDEAGNQIGFPYMCKADDGSILEIEDMKSVDPGKAAAALNGAAIKALYDRIIELEERLKALDGLDA
jgi:hypothetical protein